MGRWQVLLVIGLIQSGVLCRQAHAEFIDGMIELEGSPKFDAKSLADASKVKTWDNVSVVDRSGDFMDFVSSGESAAVDMPWRFKASKKHPASLSVGGFTFDLTSSSVNSQNSKLLSVDGSGSISGNGFDVTPGSWSFTSNKVNGSTSTNFVFQAAASPVPEPSVPALIAGGFASLLAVQRFLRRRS